MQGQGNCHTSSHEGREMTMRHSHNAHQRDILTTTISGTFSQCPSEGQSHNAHQRDSRTTPIRGTILQCPSEGHSLNAHQRDILTMPIRGTVSQCPSEGHSLNAHQRDILTCLTVPAGRIQRWLQVPVKKCQRSTRVPAARCLERAPVPSGRHRTCHLRTCWSRGTADEAELLFWEETPSASRSPVQHQMEMWPCCSPFPLRRPTSPSCSPFPVLWLMRLHPCSPTLTL